MNVAPNAESLDVIARCKGVEQAVFQAVEGQFTLLEIRAALPNAPVGDIIRAWLLCFRIPIQQPGNPRQKWIRDKVAALLKSEGENVEGLTLQIVLERFAPWLLPPSLL
jgi:hypothetical protein